MKRHTTVHQLALATHMGTDQAHKAAKDTTDLERVNDSILDQVFVFVGSSVVAIVGTVIHF